MMSRHRFLFTLQVTCCFLLQVKANSISLTVTASSFSTVYPAVNATGALTTSVVTTSAMVNTSTTHIQPTTSTTTTTATSSQVVTPSPPPVGSQEAVEFTVEKMTTVEFEAKRTAFLNTMKTVVEDYCSSQSCGGSSRKRRAVSVNEVYIASGYPRQSGPSNLLVAVFVATGNNTYLSKNFLVRVIEVNNGNLSSSLGKKITGVRRLNLDDFTKAAPTGGGLSPKTQILAIFLGVLAGIVVTITVCICVACWIGRKSERDDNVRPLTTSNMDLVENTRAK